MRVFNERTGKCEDVVPGYIYAPYIPLTVTSKYPLWRLRLWSWAYRMRLWFCVRRTRLALLDCGESDMKYGDKHVAVGQVWRCSANGRPPYDLIEITCCKPTPPGWIRDPIVGGYIAAAHRMVQFESPSELISMARSARALKRGLS